MKHGDSRNSTLAALANTAIDAIRTLVTDSNTPPAVRFRAAKFILESIAGPGNDGDDDNNKPMPAPTPVRQANNTAPEPPRQSASVAAQNSNLRPPAKVGRNDTCPCGSGLKFKKCCLRKLELQRRPDCPKTAPPLPLAREGPLATAA